jgi:hypothetical protein
MRRLIIALVLGFFLLPKPMAMADEPVVIAQPPIMDSRAMALGTYFSSHNCPLTPYADDFIRAADKYNIDYRFLPAISIHESTCGKRYPINSNNPFGWLERAGTVYKFKSIPDAIDFITGQLANGKYYAGKTLYKKLNTYCPTPGYPEETLSYMNLFKPIQ